MTDEQIKHMAQRFLGWRIPEPFRPDAGISFDPVFNKGTRYEGRHQPLGTNLWGYTEAIEMVRYMVEGLPCDCDGTATAAVCEDIPVPQDCQARAAGIARPQYPYTQEQTMDEVIDWQPIETAPEGEGTVIRARGFDWGDRTKRRHYVTAKREGLSWIDATGDDKTYYRYLTDWKPLDRIKDQSHGG